ncbi:MAG: uroporphyrinogen-III C-methyltransferase [Halanaerobiales bacterium]
MKENRANGKVYLIGAGPGDEELITLKAIKALKDCTVVMYDRLINPNLLNYLSEDCKIIYCGKRPWHHSKSQNEINQMLIDFVKNGHKVGRIKGGDPFVFGRGGEEALKLVEEGIEFEVIPGITSPIAVLSYAGIPITHRGISQSFHVYTGTSADKLNINWEAAAKNEGTLVFLMGLGNIDMIMDNLIANGKRKNTPCAVIMKGTTYEQKITTGNIDNISDKVKEEKFKPPCIIAVGEVVKLSNYLNWWEKKPLSGMNVCVTRSKTQAKEFSDKLKGLGAAVTEINTIDFEDQTMNLAEYIEKLSDYDYIVLTSVNAVNYFFNYLKKISYDIRQINAKFAAVGPATEQAIIDKGIIPEVTCDEFCAEDLFAKLKKQVNKEHKVLAPRSKSGKRDLIDNLKSIGCIVDEVNTYDVISGKIKDFNDFNSSNVVTFTSPSTVKNLIDMVGKESIKQKFCIAIGPITTKELNNQGIECITADEYCIDGIIEKLKEVNNDL